MLPTEEDMDDSLNFEGEYPEKSWMDNFTNDAWKEYFLRPDSWQAKLYDIMDGTVAVVVVLTAVMVMLLLMV